jgi:hypothetical protein
LDRPVHWGVEGYAAGWSAWNADAESRRSPQELPEVAAGLETVRGEASLGSFDRCQELYRHLSHVANRVDIGTAGLHPALPLRRSTLRLLIPSAIIHAPTE